VDVRAVTDLLQRPPGQVLTNSPLAILHRV
jgi:hypothetical protein